MPKKRLQGGIRLLTEKDLQPGVLNMNGQSLIGWEESTFSPDAHINPIYGGLLARAIVQKAYPEGHPQAGQLGDLYDQFMFFQDRAIIVVARDQRGRVALVQNWRNTGKRPGRKPKILRDFDKKQLGPKLVARLGETHWEVPRGMPDGIGRVRSLKEFARKAARLETSQESGYRIENIQILGEPIQDTTWFPYGQMVVSGTIVGRRGRQRPEDMEIIGQSRLFTPRQLSQIFRRGKTFNGVGSRDGMSLMAFSLAGVHL